MEDLIMEVAGILRKCLTKTTFLVLALSLFAVNEAKAAGELISIDSSLFIQIVNFIFLIWALNVILYKPIRNILLKRKGFVSGLEEGIQAADGDVQAKEKAFNEGIRAARTDGVEKKKAMIEEAAQEEMAIVEKINSKAQADLAEVKAKIAEEADSVREALQAELDTFASAIGQKILGRAI
jgi:F-type H+-transporting ATPase subunit b